jgi:hypothetical protein
LIEEENVLKQLQAMVSPWRVCLVVLWVSLWVVWSGAGCDPQQPTESVTEQPKVTESSQEVQNTEPTVEKPVEKSVEKPVETFVERRGEPVIERLRELRPESILRDLMEPTPELPADNTLPLPGFGAISGMCGVLDDQEWNSSSSYLFRNAIDLGSSGFDETKLTQGGQKIWKDGNLGGSSVHSEVFSYELLKRCELATLLKSEGEIKYKDAGGKKTDLLVTIDGRKVGVSVTRAFHFPPSNPYTEQEATTLLTKKLADIPKSEGNADPADAWVRSVLHILAYNSQYADSVEAAYKKLDATINAKTILVVTVTDGKDDYIY